MTPLPTPPAADLSWPADPAAWWAEHLMMRAEHEKALGIRIEERSQALAGLSGSLVAAGVGLITQLPEKWSALLLWDKLICAGGLLVLLCAALVFWVNLSHMPGRRFHPGTVPGWIWGWLAPQGRSRPRQVQANGSIMHLGGQTARGAQSDRVKAALGSGEQGLARSAESRRQVVEILDDQLRADLEWWLTPANPEEVHDLRQIESRGRVVFWYLANREVRFAKGHLLNLGLDWLFTGFLFVVASQLPWYLQLPALLMGGGILALRWLRQPTDR
jgi:hypothetical protein